MNHKHSARTNPKPLVTKKTVGKSDKSASKCTNVRAWNKLMAPRLVKHAFQKVGQRTRLVIAIGICTYLGRFAQALAVLITIPLARETLDPELFGVWMMLSALLGFMAFADLGIGGSVLNRVTATIANNDKAGLEKTLVCGFGINGLLGCVLFLAWLVWSTISDEPTALVGHISPENRPEVFDALQIFAAILAINIPASLILRVQLGAQQGYLNGLNQLAVSLLTVALVPLSLSLGGSVPELVLATLGVQAAVNTANCIVWLLSNGLLSKEIVKRFPELQAAKDLLKSGSMFFLLQLSAAFAFQSDAIVIAQTLGQSTYGDFAIVQKLFLFVSMLLNAAMTGLWPAFGDALERKDKDWAVRSLKIGVLFALVMTVTGVAALTLSMPWILENWVDSDVPHPWGLLLALSVWTILDGVACIVASFMNGANILRGQLALAVAMASTAFLGKLFLTPMLGPTGAVIATIIAYCLISVPGQIFLLSRALNTKR